MKYSTRFHTLLFLFSAVVVNATVLAVEHEDLIGWWVLDGEFIKSIVVDMQKTASKKDQQMLKFFLPTIEKRAKAQTFIFTKTEFVTHRGFSERRIPYVVKGTDGDIITLDMEGREVEFALADGRLVSKRELDGKGPAMYMRKLGEAEIAVRKEAVAAARRPPAATAPPEKRLSFLLYKATPAQIDRLLAQEKDLLTIRDPRSPKRTAVHMAAASRKNELLKKLLAAGADANATDSQGENALFRTVELANREAFDLLVAAGASATQCNANEETLLMAYCRQSRDVSFLKHLLTLGIPINHVSKFGGTALSKALASGWVAGGRILIAAGADVKLVGEALARIVRKADVEAIKLLLENGFTQDQYGKTALMYALRSDSKKVRKRIPQFVELGRDTLDLKDSEGKTALFFARDLATAECLVAAGADVAATSRWGNSILHAMAGSPELLAFYVERQKVDIGALNDRKQTPLQQACAQHGNLEAIQYLVSKGADIDHVDSFGATPLSWALTEKSDERLSYVKFLVAKGADLKAPSRLECINRIIGKDFETALRFLVTSGMSVQTDPKQHYTPFWYAIFYDKPKYVTLLIELGADPATKNAAGKTALDIATEFKKGAIIKLLSK